MAMTQAQKTGAYQFFAIAFGAAPGVEYMNQIDAAFATGATLKDVVNAFVSKPQFTSQYPNFFSYEQFADKLIEDVVGDSATTKAKEQAKADTVAALNAGLSRGDVIYNIFNNLASKPAGDPDWAQTAKLMKNAVAVAQYFTETLLVNTTDLATLQKAFDGLTPATDVSSPAAIQAFLNQAGAVPGETFMLTFDQDVVVGTSGNDTIKAVLDEDLSNAPYSTLTLGDKIDGGYGIDTLEITSNGDGEGDEIYMAGVTITNVENLKIIDADEDFQDLDLSSKTFSRVEIVNPTDGLTIDGVALGTGFKFTNTEDSHTINFVGATGTADVLNLEVAGTNTGDDVSFTVANIETVNLTVSAAAKLNGSTFANATALNITATANIDGDAADTIALANDAVITVTGAGNVQLGTLDDNGAGEGVTVTASAMTGKLTVVGGANTVAITSGSGNDKITSNSAATKVTTGAGNDSVTIAAAVAATNTIDLGDGDDTLTLSAAPVAGATLTAGAGTDTIGLVYADYTTVSGYSAANLAKITGFEALSITTAALANGNVVDLSKLSGLTSAQILGVATGGAASITNVGANSSVILKGDLATDDGSLTIALKDATGTADVLNLTLDQAITQDNDGTVDTFTSDVAGITASGVETINFTSTGTLSTTVTAGAKTDVAVNALALTDTALVTLNIKGDQGFTFSSAAGSVKLATVDASANTAGGTVDVSAAATDGTAAAITITGSAGSDTLTGSGNADTISGGAGADTITGGAKADTLSGGTGNDTFVIAAGTDSTLVAMDVISDFSANTYGNGTNGAAGTGAAADTTKWTGDVLKVNVDTATITKVDSSVQANAADALTFIQNVSNSTADTMAVALDSSTGKLYIDLDSDGVVDSVVGLTGVTTITEAAFVLY